MPRNSNTRPTTEVSERVKSTVGFCVVVTDHANETGGTRTRDPSIKSAVLYQLSYGLDHTGELLH